VTETDHGQSCEGNGQQDGKYEGFQFGKGNIQMDDTLLLIEPDAASAYEAQTQPPSSPSPGESTPSVSPSVPAQPSAPTRAAASATAFHGTADIAPATAKMRLVQIADEIISALGSDPNASIKVVLEVSAEFPYGVKDSIKRAVSENARSLGLKSVDWE
jgi:hypothetical protein